MKSPYLKVKKLYTLLISSLLVILTLPVMAMELIIFESNNSNYIAGSSIDSEATIELKDGQMLTLISPNGEIIKLTGPHNQAISTSNDEHNKGISQTLKILLVAVEANSKDLGVTRNSTEVIRASKKYGWVPEPWVVNLNRSGDNCIHEDREIKLWRSGTEAVQLKLSMGDEFAAYKDLKKDETFISPPKEMPIKDGGKYQFTMKNNKIDTTLHLIPKRVSSTPVYAAWMQQMGCYAQATAMLRNYNK